MADWFFLLSGIVFGLCFGSFATMLSYRVPRGMSIVSPRSHCVLCLHTLESRDLVPILSWVLTRGRCRFCGAKISARYPVIEMVTTSVTAIGFVWIGASLWLVPFSIGVIALVASGTALIERFPTRCSRGPMDSRFRGNDDSIKR